MATHDDAHEVTHEDTPRTITKNDLDSLQLSRREAFDALQGATEDVSWSAALLAVHHRDMLVGCAHGRQLMFLLDQQRAAFLKWQEARDADDASRLIASAFAHSKALR